MKRITALLFCTLLLSPITWGNELDSLLATALTQAEHSLDESLRTLDLAQDKNSELNNQEMEARIHYHRGLAYDKNLQDKKALTAYFLALKNLPDKADNLLRSALHNSIGLSYLYLRQHDSAHIHTEMVLNLNKKNPDHKEIGIAYLTRGNIKRRENNIDSTLYYYRLAAHNAKKGNDPGGLSKAFNSTGIVHFSIQQYDSALYYYKKYFNIRDEEGDARGAAIALTNMGNVYQRIGNYSEAIINYNEALQYFQEIQFLEGIGSCYNNIATIYENLVVGGFHKENIQTYKQALGYHENALETRKKQGDSQKIAASLNNIGTIHFKIEEAQLFIAYGDHFKDSIRTNSPDKKPYFQKALDYYEEALKIQEELEYTAGMASVMSNIGRVYYTLGQYDKSISLYNESVQLSRDINNRHELSLGLFQLGLSFHKLKDDNKALDYLRQALQIAKEINNKELKKSCHENISEIKEHMQDYQAALDHYKRFKQVNDSLFNEESSRIINEIRTQYETEKQEQRNVQLQLENDLTKQQNSMQRLIILAFIIVLLIIAAFTILIFRQFQQIKKSNKLLEEKNMLISEQKQEITDSIQYASRIQKAILPPKKILDELIQPEYFILYRPRDIVSGDYYWATEQNNKVILVAADCTGHGVPGAFMSMLGVAFLNEIVNQSADITASEILNQLRHHVITSLHQTGEPGTSQDGMDMAVCIIDKPNMMLDYAGANNPLVMIRNNELIQYKADKMPVGIYLKTDIPFTSHRIPIQKDDCIYIFSDGYQDQFGGPNGKKFMIKNMKTMFLQHHKKTMHEQQEIMEQTLLEWMGEEYEAIDDIIVMGIRI